MDKLLHWVIFHAVLFILLALDLGFWRKQPKEPKIGQALLWSLFWIGLSLIFNLFIYITQGPELALRFFTGYLIEKSLSVDNLFVFLVIFSFFKIPKKHQHKVLFYGILGALITRILFIVGGVALLHRFEWVTYILGAFLCATAIRLFIEKDKPVKPKENFLVKWMRNFFPVTSELHSDHFFVKQKSRLYMTPLFLALLVIESTDIVFAIDSIPAIFSVTRDPYIAYTSNVCAILGLRSIYFVLDGFMDKFHYLKVGLSAILLLVGAKMLLSFFFELPIWLMLLFIVFILAAAIFASLLRSKNSPGAEQE